MSMNSPSMNIALHTLASLQAVVTKYSTTLPYPVSCDLPLLANATWPVPDQQSTRGTMSPLRRKTAVLRTQTLLFPILSTVLLSKVQAVLIAMSSSRLTAYSNISSLPSLIIFSTARTRYTISPHKPSRR